MSDKDERTKPHPTDAAVSLRTLVDNVPAQQSNSEKDLSLHTVSDAEEAGPRTLRDSDRSLNTFVEGNISHPSQSTAFLSTTGTPGRFRVLRPHARGGLGQVSVALDQELNREVALKEILEQYSDDPSAQERFLLEAEITGGLEHPGIVPVYGLGHNVDGRPYYAMRFIRGDSLKQSIDDYHQAKIPQLQDPGKKLLALRQLLDRFIDVCNAMEYAHSRGILHRDLKPANIMVGKFGETLVVDWGLAKAIGQPEQGSDAPLRPSSVLSGSIQTMQGSAVGTPAYMSPEQAAGRLDQLGTASDIYSLGATLFHLLCGRPPFENQDLAEVLRRVRTGDFPRPGTISPQVPRGLEAVCLKAMALNPSDRYRTAHDVANDIEHWLADEPISAAQDTTAERISRWARKHKGLVQAGGVSLLLVTFVSSVSYAIVSLANSRLNSANITIRDQNAAITEKNDELRTTNVHLAAARVEAEQKRDEARELVREASRSDYATAQGRLADGKWSEAIAYLGRSLRYDPENANSRDALWLGLRYGHQDATSLPRYLLQHRSAVQTARFSPDGTRIVTASRDNTARIWESRTGTQLGPEMTHPGTVGSAIFSDDGTRVITISNEKSLQIWDAITQLPLGPPLLSPDHIYTAIFSPDGTLVLTASEDGFARIYQAGTELLLAHSLPHQDAVYFATFSRDGSRVITASGDTTSQIWDPQSGQPLGPPLRHQGAVFNAMFSPDGALAITASADTTARIWDVSTGQPTCPPLQHERSVTAAKFSPDGSRVITTSDDKTAKVWNARSGLPIGRPLVHDGPVTTAQFSPDGTRVVTSSEDRTSRVWDIHTGQEIGHPFQHLDIVSDAAFSPDGTMVVTTSDNSSARLWYGQTGLPPGFVMRHTGSVYTGSFSPDGTLVLTSSSDSTAQIWSAQTGEPIGHALRHDRSITSAQFSPNGTKVITASDDSTARVWDTRTGQPISPPLQHRGVVTAARFHPDGTRVVTASHDGTARIWSLPSGTPVGLTLKHRNFVSTASFSPDGTAVVTASRDKTAQLWNSETGEPMGKPMQHDDAVYAASFSPDGATIVTASRDKLSRIWNARTGEPIGAPLEHAESVYIAVYRPDGNQILTVQEGGVVQCWDAKTHAQVGSPMLHGSRVNSVSFSRDGIRIVTACEDAAARIWNAETGQSIGPPLVHEAGLNDASFSPDGTRIVTADDAKTARIWDVRTPDQLEGAQAEYITTIASGRQLGRRSGTLDAVSTDERLNMVTGLGSLLPANSDWSMLSQMVLKPEPDSPISPNSKLTRRQSVTSLIKSGSPPQIRQALYLDPGHPLIQIALAGLKENAEQADFLRHYGIKHLPDDIQFLHDAADMLMNQNDLAGSAKVIDRLEAIEPGRVETIKLIKSLLTFVGTRTVDGELGEWLVRARQRIADAPQ